MTSHHANPVLLACLNFLLAFVAPSLSSRAAAVSGVAQIVEVSNLGSGSNALVNYRRAYIVLQNSDANLRAIMNILLPALNARAQHPL